jgi:hypothetical protein
LVGGALTHQDASKNAAGIDAETAGREIGFGVLIGANGRDGNLGCWDTRGKELLTIALREINMPFLTNFAADGSHLETIVGKGFVNLVAHLEALYVNARTYLGLDVSRTGAVS